MKTLVLAVSLFFSASAFAALDFSQGQSINKFEINGNATEYTGKVTIAKPQIGENINIHVLSPIDCPLNQICPAVMREIELEAKVISISESCGSIVYHAVTDGTPYDGPRTEITVQDHSTRVCRDMRQGLIEINAKENYLRLQIETNYFAVQTHQ